MGGADFAFNDHYLLISVIKGDGALSHNGDQYELEKGTHFIIPVGFGDFEVDGNCELIFLHT
ncbi:hypothetical protein [Neobacillus drentensis]|jgi:mannose-6-phosphate isomerase|uniref:hypothetical protein n=1 Tax=Neobacillus drentensis TaxID=220684 RepID=UPI003002E891